MSSLEGEIVWEYITPVCTDGIKKVITIKDFDNHSSFRARRFGPDHPALKDKDLSPRGTITALADKGELSVPPS